MTWHKLCTVLFDWVKHGEQIGATYAEKLIEKTARVNADVLMFCPQIGGYVVYDSEIAPRYPYLDEDVDILRILVEKGHEKSIKIVPFFLHTSIGGAGLQAKEHPDWVIQRPGGEPHWTNMWMCINSPFRDFQLAQLREMLANYEVDGVYFDQLYVSCWCHYCREKFKNQYNVDMPEDPEDSKVIEFRDDTCVEYCRRIHKIIKERRPETIYIQNSVFLTYAALEKAMKYVDAFLPESHFGGGPYPNWLIQDHSLYDRLNRAHSNKPIFRNVGGGGHAAGVVPSQQLMLTTFEALLNKTSPVLIEMGRYDFGGRGFKEATKTFSHIQKLKNYVKEADPIKYCALIHSQANLIGEFAWTSALNENYESLRGFYHLLIENHVPVEVLSERNIKEGELRKYKVLILPNVTHLDDETVIEIERFVKNGGGLVMTYKTGLIEPLASLAGFHYTGVTARSNVRVARSVDLPKGYCNYFKIRKESPIAENLKGYLFAFQGNFLEGEYESDCQIIADILGYDQNKVNMPFFNRRGLYPGEPVTPLLTLRKVGKGAVAFFSSQVGIAAWRMGGNADGCSPEISQLIVEAVKCVGGNVPLTTKGIPESVDISVYYDLKRRTYTVILVNLTTNQFEPVKRVRYVVPLDNLRLSIAHPGAEVKKVVSATGNEVECSIEGDQIVVNIPKLSFYEGAVIELK